MARNQLLEILLCLKEELCKDEKQKTEYLTILRRRSRRAMELLIDEQNISSMKWLWALGWFDEQQLVEFMKYASKKERKLAWLWFYQVKNGKDMHENKGLAVSSEPEEAVIDYRHSCERILEIIKKELCLEYTFLYSLCEKVQLDDFTQSETAYRNWISLFSDDPHELKMYILKEMLRMQAIAEFKISEEDLEKIMDIFERKESPEDELKLAMQQLGRSAGGKGGKSGSSSLGEREEIQLTKRGIFNYKHFLRRFMQTKEELEIDDDSFDYIYYTWGMDNCDNIPLIEELEYKEVNRLDQLVIAIDTSGSCKKEIVQQFLEETYAIISGQENFFKKMLVYILQCDCAVQTATVIHSEKEWKEFQKSIEIHGRGGTDFTPVFRYVKQKQKEGQLNKLKALIYFTDGDGVYPDEKPPYETSFVFLTPNEHLKKVPSWSRGLVVRRG